MSKLTWNQLCWAPTCTQHSAPEEWRLSRPWPWHLQEWMLLVQSWLLVSSAGVNANFSILALGVICRDECYSFSSGTWCLPRVNSRFNFVTALQHSLRQFLPIELSGFLMVPLLISQANIFFTGSGLDCPFLSLDFPESSLREVYERLWYMDGDSLLFCYWYCLFFIATISLVISLGIGEMGRLTHTGLYYHIELEHKFNFHIFHIIWLSCAWFSFSQSRKKKGFSLPEDTRWIWVKLKSH